MLKKKGKRVLENADAVMTHLQAKFPAAEFETLEGEAIAVMSVKQQVQAFHCYLVAHDLCMHTLSQKKSFMPTLAWRTLPSAHLLLSRSNGLTVA